MKKTPTMHRCSIEPIHFSDVELIFKKDDHGQPCVICAEQRNESIHTEIYSLIEKIPELYENEQLVVLATLVNFLSKGEEFKLIINPKKYKLEYNDQIEREENSFDLPFSPLISYGVFNIEEVCSPHIEKGKGNNNDSFVFYVAKKIPFKVTCDFPIETEDSHFKYEILEYV